MRSLRRSSKKQSPRALPIVSPQPESSDNFQAEQHPEPIGHVHDHYRHWVWLGLHRREG